MLWHVRGTRPTFRLLAAWVAIALYGLDLRGECGAPGGTRTPDRLLRRQLLYPTELQALSADIVPDSGHVSDTCWLPDSGDPRHGSSRTMASSRSLGCLGGRIRLALAPMCALAVAAPRLAGSPASGTR